MPPGRQAEIGPKAALSLAGLLVRLDDVDQPVQRERPNLSAVGDELRLDVPLTRRECVDAHFLSSRRALYDRAREEADAQTSRHASDNAVDGPELHLVESPHAQPREVVL